MDSKHEMLMLSLLSLCLFFADEHNYNVAPTQLAVDPFPGIAQVVPNQHVAVRPGLTPDGITQVVPTDYVLVVSPDQALSEVTQVAPTQQLVEFSPNQAHEDIIKADEQTTELVVSMVTIIQTIIQTVGPQDVITQLAETNTMLLKTLLCMYLGVPLISVPGIVRNIPGIDVSVLETLDRYGLQPRLFEILHERLDDCTRDIVYTMTLLINGIMHQHRRQGVHEQTLLRGINQTTRRMREEFQQHGSLVSLECTDVFSRIC